MAYTPSKHDGRAVLFAVAGVPVLLMVKQETHQEMR